MTDNGNAKGRINDMLKELEVKRTDSRGSSKESPIKAALEQYKKDSGFNFFDIMNDPKIRAKHKLLQLQKEEYPEDDEFIRRFQKYQVKDTD